MSSPRRIAFNTLITIIGDISSKILMLFFTILAARYLQVEGYGAFSFTISFAVIFYILTDLGFFELLVREVARDHDLAAKFSGNLIVLKAFIVFPIYFFMVVVAIYSGFSFVKIALIGLIGLSTVVIDSFTLVFQGIFRSFERLVYPSIGKILKSVILLLGTWVVINSDLGILSFGYLYLSASFIWLIISLFIITKKFTKPKLEIDKRLWKYIIKEGLPFWAISIFLIIYYQIDIVMLSLLRGDYDVGIYSAAYKLITSLNFIPIAFYAALFPVTSRLYVSSRDSLKFLFHRSFKYISIVAFYMSVFIFFFPEFIIELIYGQSYSPSSNVLRILVISEAILFTTTILGNLLNSINKQLLCAIQTGLASSINVFLDYILIPEYGYMGAGYATVVADIFSFVFLFLAIASTEYRFEKANFVEFFKIVSSGVFLFILLIYLKPFGFLTSLFVSGLFYIAMLFLFKIVDSIDIALAKKIVGVE